MTAPQSSGFKDGDLHHLPVAEISAQDGFNPRTFFDDADFQALVDSVRQQGVLQSIVVRPREDGASGFWLIAGERRWRAARAAGLATIPAIIRRVDGRAALALADIENSKRADLSPAEEARTARRMIDFCEGDRTEAAKLLGWSPAKLEARVLLLHAHPEVLKALAERRIKLGHAELLSGLPAESQPGTLASVLEKQIPVAGLKARIAAFALDLSSAIFDQTDCAACPHNSNLQTSLFTETIGGGHCQNRACFAAKTQAALATRREALKSEYPVVWLDTEKAPNAYTTLQEHGSQGVGPAQFQACKGCRHYGALMETAPGREGQVVPGLCFNLSCHQKKVKAFQGQTTTPATAAPAAPPGRARPPTNPTAAKAAPPAVIPPKKVEEAVDGFYRHTAARIAAANPEVARAVLLFSALMDAGFPHALLASHPLPASRRREDLVPALIALDTPAKQALLAATVDYLLAHAGPGLAQEMVTTAQVIVSVTGFDLAGHFTLDEAFLKAHTKAGIEALMSEARNADGQTFAEWYNAKRKDQAAFKKLMGRRAEEIIKAILDSGFDFSRFVPATVSRRLARAQALPRDSVKAGAGDGACVPTNP